MNLPPLQAEARLKCDIKAITTIAITIATYFLCYVPSIVYAVVGLQNKNQAEHWFGFSAWYCLHISSSVNPLIYYLANNRFRSAAFKQFLKDAVGSSDFKETPQDRSNGKKQKVNGVEIKKRDCETTKTGQIREIQIDVNQTNQEYSAVEKRNVRLIL